MRRAVDSSQKSVASRRKTEGRRLSEGDVKLEVRNRVDEAKDRSQKTVGSTKAKLTNYCLLLTAFHLLHSGARAGARHTDAAAARRAVAHLYSEHRGDAGGAGHRI